MTDKTNYAQSLMHMIKGNLGTGILAMPASFAHTGLYNALYGLPFLCIISTYCVHLLIKSSSQLENKSKGITFKYSTLAKCSFEFGPNWLRSSSGLMSKLVDGILLIAQIGVCCVYLVFVVDNITSILGSYSIKLNKTFVFMAIFPIALLLSYIKTLNKLAIASGFANFLQAVGISIILEFLIRDISKIDLAQRDKFRSFEDTALGFGSAMFAFEGISVVLPVYTRMKYPNKMSGLFGVINVSYIVLLILYFAMGLFGFLKFGRQARDSITLNLPAEPIYDVVRAIFTISVFLTYPLQFYVPNEIIWNWAKRNIISVPEDAKSPFSSIAVVKAFDSKTEGKIDNKNISTIASIKSNLPGVEGDKGSLDTISDRQLVIYEYYCRTILDVMTFVLAISVPKLNLLMDLIGSISGTALSLIIPAIIHMAAFWDSTRGFKKFMMVLIDSLLIVFGLGAGISGTIFSSMSIFKSFSNNHY